MGYTGANGRGTGGSSHPGNLGYFAATNWSSVDTDELKRELAKAIEQDPGTGHASNVGLELVLDGGKVAAIKLAGKVASASERDRAEEIVRVNTRDEVEVINELAIE